MAQPDPWNLQTARKLTFDREESAFYARHLLVGTLNQAQSSVHRLLVTTVHKQQRALEGPVLIRLRVLFRIPLSSSCTQELRENQQLLLQLSLTVSKRLSLSLLLDLLHLCAVNRREVLLLLLQLCLVLCVELLVLLHLLLESSELGLQLGLLESGCLLVLVDLTLGDKLVKRDVGILLDHSVGLVHRGELLVDCAHVLDQRGDVGVLGAALDGLSDWSGGHCE